MLFLQQIVNGLVIGSVYALIALGVTLVFGLTRLINFAHGEFLAVGALLTWALANHGLPYVVAAAIATVAVAAIAAALERVVFRPTLREPVSGFIVSLGVIAISESILTQAFGAEPHRVAGSVSGVLKFGSVSIANDQVVLIVATAILTVGVFLVLERTGFGRRVRATIEDSFAASLLGIKVDATIALTFVIGSALAGVAGVLMVTTFVISPFSGLALVIKGFIAAIVGGLGDVRGAVLAGLLLGIIETLGAAYVSSSWQDGFGYGLMIVILLFRPSGLFQRGTARAA